VNPWRWRNDHSRRETDLGPQRRGAPPRAPACPAQLRGVGGTRPAGRNSWPLHLDHRTPGAAGEPGRGSRGLWDDLGGAPAFAVSTPTRRLGGTAGGARSELPRPPGRTRSKSGPAATGEGEGPWAPGSVRKTSGARPPGGARGETIHLRLKRGNRAKSLIAWEEPGGAKSLAGGRDWGKGESSR